MLDAFARSIIDPPLNKLSSHIAKTSITGNMVTIIGFGFGVMACIAIAMNYNLIALTLLVINRLFDGFDGGVARARNETSDFGGYLDIVLDFFIYAGFPFFASISIGTSAAYMASAFVIFSIVCAGVSFLAYAIIAEKRKIKTSKQGKKSFYFSNGLMEGTETIIFLCLICLFPLYFPIICYVFGGLCLITAILRIWNAYQEFE